MGLRKKKLYSSTDEKATSLNSVQQKIIMDKKSNSR